MKLSSAFSETDLLNGCSGKQALVMDEVVAAAGTDLSYLTKSNEMQKIESKDSVPVDSFNGVFSLSDESGINTIAYGDKGTIYGCFNYSGENIASYSKAYAGSTILASTYAAGSVPNEDGDSPSDIGLLVGITLDTLLYSESDGNWTTVAISGESVVSNKTEFWNIFSAGSKIFIASSAGLVCFDVADMNRSGTPSISESSLSILLKSQNANLTAEEIRSISFIRKLRLNSTDGTDAALDAYAVGYTKSGDPVSGTLATMNAVLCIDAPSGWTELDLHMEEGQDIGTGFVLSDIEAVSNAFFPEMVETECGLSADYADRANDGQCIEDVPMIGTGSARGTVSILSPSEAANSTKWPVPETETINSLRLETSDGYAVLASLSNIDNINANVDDDYVQGSTTLFEYQKNGNEWNQRKPWTILNESDPMPVHLETDRIYRTFLSSGGNRTYARWIEDYYVDLSEGKTPAPFPTAEEIETGGLGNLPSVALPAGAVQLFCDPAAAPEPAEGEEPQEPAEKSSAELKITLPYRIRKAWLCLKIEDPKAEINQGSIYTDIATGHSWQWIKAAYSDNMYWSQVTSIPPGTAPIDGYFVTRQTQAVVEEAYYVLPLKGESDSIASSLAYGVAVDDEEGGKRYMLNVSGSFENLRIPVDPLPDSPLMPDSPIFYSDTSELSVSLFLNDFEIPYFDKTVKFRIAFQREPDSEETQPVTEMAARLQRDADNPMVWNEGTAGKPYGETRIMYSQTGIFSKLNNGTYVGNLLQCGLLTQNAGDSFLFSMPPEHREQLAKLNGAGRTDGIDIYRSKKFRNADGIEFSKNILCGSIYLSADGKLQYSKTSADGKTAAAGIEKEQKDGTYAPLMLDESGNAAKLENGEIQWTKSPDGRSLTGKLLIAMPSAMAVDYEAYEGKWTEDFAQCAMVPAPASSGSGALKAYLDKNGSDDRAYVYSLANEDGSSFLSVPLIDAVPQLGSSEKTLTYAFRYAYDTSFAEGKLNAADRLGCISRLTFKASQSSPVVVNTKFRALDLNIVSGGPDRTAKILGRTAFWTLDHGCRQKIVNKKNADEVFKSVQADCLNFSGSENEFFSLLPQEDGEGNVEKYTLVRHSLYSRTVQETQTVEDEEGNPVEQTVETDETYLVARELEIEPADIAEDGAFSRYGKTSPFRLDESFTFCQGLPVWIDNAPYWLSVVNSIPLDSIMSDEELEALELASTENSYAYQLLPVPTSEAFDAVVESEPEFKEPAELDIYEPAEPDKPEKLVEYESLEEPEEPNTAGMTQEDIDTALEEYSSQLEEYNRLMAEYEEYKSNSPEYLSYSLAYSTYMQNKELYDQTLAAHTSYEKRKDLWNDWINAVASGQHVQTWLENGERPIAVWQTKCSYLLSLAWNADSGWTASAQYHSDVIYPAGTRLNPGSAYLAVADIDSGLKWMFERIDSLVLASVFRTTSDENGFNFTLLDSAGDLSEALALESLYSRSDAEMVLVKEETASGQAVRFKRIDDSMMTTISSVQYTDLKQWLVADGRKKVIVKMLDGGNGWRLYEEKEESGAGGSTVQVWNEWDSSQYEGSKVVQVFNESDWPAFVPVVGKVYNVTLNHLTAEPNYSAGRYVFLGAPEGALDSDATDAAVITASYVKLPDLSQSKTEGKAHWSDWLKTPESSVWLFAVGKKSSGDGICTARKISVSASGGSANPVGFKSNWLPAGGFALDGSSAGEKCIPSQQCQFSFPMADLSLPDTSSEAAARKRAVGIGITIGSGSSAKRFVYRTSSSSSQPEGTAFKIGLNVTFAMPSIAGMFEIVKSSERTSMFMTGPQIDSVNLKNSSGKLHYKEVKLTSIPLSPKEYPNVKPISLSVSPLQNGALEWAASVDPIQPMQQTASDPEQAAAWLVGMYGTTSLQYKSGKVLSADTKSAGVYSSSVKKTATNASGAMPSIKAPDRTAPEGSSAAEGVLWNRQGFHVKFNRNSTALDNAYNSESSYMPEGLAQTLGSESIATKRSIIAMEAVKAYNAPIIFGLYESGGLILYYGKKCFDKSVLFENRNEKSRTEKENVATAWIASLFLKESDSPDAETLALQQDAGRILRNWLMPEFSGKLKESDVNTAGIPLLAMNAAGGNSAAAKKLALAAGLIPDPEGDEIYATCSGTASAGSVDLSASSISAKTYNDIVSYVFSNEAEKRFNDQADASLIQSCEYSVNNSPESQWIDIPIYYLAEDGTAVELPREEKLATLSTTTAGGRIRVIVGAQNGDVYWRDLNPLHADRYISYIPMQFLSTDDKNQIEQKESVASLATYQTNGTEELKKFIDGSQQPSGGQNEPQAVKSGWTQCSWRWNGTGTAPAETRLTVHGPTEASMNEHDDSAMKKWIYVNGKNIGVNIPLERDAKLASGEMTAKNGASNIYVWKRVWVWTVEGRKTSVEAYANAPQVKFNASGVPYWTIGGVSAARADKGVYPEVYRDESDLKLYWKIKGMPAGRKYEVQMNGMPYIQNGRWLVVQTGRTSPTDLGAATPAATSGAATISDPVDHWKIASSTMSGGTAVLGNDGSVVYKSSADKTDSVKFSVGQRLYWHLKNVTLANGAKKTLYNTGVAVKDGQKIKDCPYVLAPEMQAIVDTANETPVWSSRENSEAVLARNLFVSEADLGDGKIECSIVDADASNGHGILYSHEDLFTAEEIGDGTASLWIGKSGKSLWLIDQTVGPYVSDARAVSTVGERWTLTRKTASNSSFAEGLASIHIDYPSPQNNETSATRPDELTKKSAAILNMDRDPEYWIINGSPLYASADGRTRNIDPSNGSAPRVSVTKDGVKYYLCTSKDWKNPVKSTVWIWNLVDSGGQTVADAYGREFQETTTVSECPFKQVEEICAWTLGKPLAGVGYSADISLAAGDHLENGKTEWVWLVEGKPAVNASGDQYRCLSPEEEKAKDFYAEPAWNAGRCIMNWYGKVKSGSGTRDVQLAAVPDSADCPLSKAPYRTLWASVPGGKAVDTGIAAPVNVLAGKGLESDGIAAKNVSRLVWDETSRQWIESALEEESWTPLVSLFADAYQEESRGVLASIRYPYADSSGMLWERMSSKELFGEDGINISHSRSNGWKAYVESDGGNAAGPAFTVYVGYKEIGKNGTQPIYDNFCSIVSESTGVIHQWTQRNKDWRFEHVEIVCNKDGSLDRLVIMCSKGYIIASGPISFSDRGRSIQGAEWRSPVNPVQKVLQEYELVEKFKWVSWTSNTDTEFAAVGSSGVYVHSDDCIHFTATIPYGLDASLIEIVWDPDTGEFVIHATAPTVGEGNETTTIELDTAQTKAEDADEDFESAHAKNPQASLDTVRPLRVSTLTEDNIYCHTHTTQKSTKKVTVYYKFSPAMTVFELLPSPTREQKAAALVIIPDNVYKWSLGGRTWNFMYSKCDSHTDEVLGAGFVEPKDEVVTWEWKWARINAEGSAGKQSYITISRNKKDVAYGFQDLVRFIRAYKKTYTDSMEFIGGVGTFISSERESVDMDRKPLMVSYKELAEMGDSGLGMYSPKLQTAYELYLKAKELRDKSHYAENDCYDTYLQKIGQSLALEYKKFFSAAKRHMWTAQAFRNHYEKLSRQAK